VPVPVTVTVPMAAPMAVPVAAETVMDMKMENAAVDTEHTPKAIPTRQSSRRSHAAPAPAAASTDFEITFGPGALGLKLANAKEGTGCIAAIVDPGFQGEQLGVKCGSRIITVNGISCQDLDAQAVGGVIAVADRPLVMVLRHGYEPHAATTPANEKEYSKSHPPSQLRRRSLAATTDAKDAPADRPPLPPDSLLTLEALRSGLQTLLKEAKSWDVLTLPEIISSLERELLPEDPGALGPFEESIKAETVAQMKIILELAPLEREAKRAQHQEAATYIQTIGRSYLAHAAFSEQKSRMRTLRPTATPVQAAPTSPAEDAPASFSPFAWLFGGDGATPPSPAPVDYLSDPRMKAIPFTKLKLFIASQDSSIEEDAFQCSTKPALVALSNSHGLDLDPLFTEVPLLREPTRQAQALAEAEKEAARRAAVQAVAVPADEAAAKAAKAAKAEKAKQAAELLAAETKAAAERDAKKVAELREKVANHAEKRGQEAARRAAKQAAAHEALTAAVDQWGIDADATSLRIAIASAKLVGVKTAKAELLLKPKAATSPKAVVGGVHKRWVAWLVSPVPPPKEVTL